MALVVPALIFGLLFAAIGIATVAMEWRKKIAAMTVSAAIFFGIGGFLYWHFLPKASDVYPATTAGSQPEPKIDGPLISTMGKTHFRCPLQPAPTDRTRDQILSDMKERIQAAREAFGVSMRVSDLEDGRRLTMEPVTQEAKTRLWGMQRWTLEMRKSGPDLLVTSIIELPEPLGGIFKLLPVDPKSDQAITEHRYIEEMLNIPSGKCQPL